MEQSSNCASCKNLTAVLQKFQTKFTVYKQKILQNDENLNTFRRQNKLLASLQEEVYEKNQSIAEHQNKVKSLQVYCSALRQTLEKEKEDNDKRFNTKFKDSDEELLSLRKELEAAKTELLAQQVNNNQLVSKIEEEATIKDDLVSSFERDKKYLLEKLANSENQLTSLNRSFTLWSGLKNNRPELTRAILRHLNKWEKQSEAARLEANLLDSTDSVELDLEDSSFGDESSPISSPAKQKPKVPCIASDSSDEDFEEVAKSKSPVKLLPVGRVSGNISGSSEANQLFENELGIDEVNHPAVSPSKVNRRSISVDRKSASPRKVSPRSTISEKKSEVAKEMKNASVQAQTEVRHIGCDPVDCGEGRKIRSEHRCLASARKVFDLSSFKDNGLLESEWTSRPPVRVSSQLSHSALCSVCDSLLSKCTPCQSVFHELLESKKNEVSPRSVCQSPLRELSSDREEGRSLCSPMRQRGHDYCDTRIVEPPLVEEVLSLKFGGPTSQAKKVGVSLQTSPRGMHVKTQTQKVSSRTIGCQSKVVYMSNEASVASDRRVVDTVTTATQTDVLVAEEKLKCTLCDKTCSTVCPMKEFLKTSLSNFIHQSKFVSNLAMKDFMETSLSSLIKQSDFISSCSGVFSGYPSLEAVGIPSFYMQHPGIYAPNPAVPLYASFNPAWCYPHNVPVRGERCYVPSFKEEERYRPNERSNGEEKGKNRSRSRSRLRKSDDQTTSRRASGSPTQRHSDSKRTDSSDSSFEEIEVGEGFRKKMRPRNVCDRTSKDGVNPRKKVKDLNLRSKARLSSESSCEGSESPEKSNSRTTQLCDSLSKREKIERKTTSPRYPMTDAFANDVPRSTKARQTVVGELSTQSALVERSGNVGTVGVPGNWEGTHASSANAPPLLPAVTEESSDSSQVIRHEDESLLTAPPNDPPLLLPAVTEEGKDFFAVGANGPPRLIPAVPGEREVSRQVTRNQEKHLFAVTTDSPPVLLTAVKSQDSSLPEPQSQDEPHFAVPTHRPPRAINRKKQLFENNLRSAKSAIAFVSGGFGTLSNAVVTESDKVESVGSTTNDARLDAVVTHSSTVKKRNVSVLSDLAVQESKRYNTRSVVSSVPACSEDKSRVSPLKSTAGENASITPDAKPLSPEKSTPSSANLNYSSEELNNPQKADMPEGFCPELGAIRNHQTVKSPVKSSSLHGLAILEDDLCLSEDSDSDLETSSDKGNEVCNDIVQETCHDSVTEKSFEEVKDHQTSEKQQKVDETHSSQGSVGIQEENVAREDSQAEGKRFNDCGTEEMDLGLIDREEETRKEIHSVGSLLHKGEGMEGEFVSVEPSSKLEFRPDVRSQVGDSLCSVEEDRDDRSLAVEIAVPSGVNLVEGSNESSARVNEQENIKVQGENEHVDSPQESDEELRTAVISALVEVFPEGKLPLGDLGNNNTAPRSSIFDVSDSEEVSDFGVSTQPSTQDKDGGHVLVVEIRKEDETSCVQLFDDLEESDKNPYDVEEERLKSETKEATGGSESLEISGSVFGSLFEDLGEGDINVSGVEDLVLPDLSDDVSEVDSSLDAEELQEGEMAVSGQISPVQEPIVPKSIDTACAYLDDDTVSCSGIDAGELQDGEIAASGGISPVKGFAVVPNSNDTACATVEDDTVTSNGIDAEELQGGEIALSKFISQVKEPTVVPNSIDSACAKLDDDTASLSGIDAEELQDGVIAVSGKISSVKESTGALNCNDNACAKPDDDTVSFSMIDAEELQDEVIPVSGEISSAKESTVVLNCNNTAWPKANDITVSSDGVSSSEGLPSVHTVTDSLNGSEITKKEASILAAPKRHVPVVVAPSGPYRTRRAGRASSNLNSLSVSKTSIEKPEKKAEILSNQTQTQGCRLRSSAGAKSSVMDKKRKFTSREFVSNDSDSGSDSDKLVVAEEDHHAERTSPKDGPREKSKVDSREVVVESISIGTRTRMKTRSSPVLEYTLPVKKRRYSTRTSTASRTSESDLNEETFLGEVKVESASGSDETSSPSPNAGPKSRKSSRNVNVEATRRSSRTRTKPKRLLEYARSCSEQEDSPNDSEKEVSESCKTTAPASSSRASKLEKLRKNLSKGHPLLQSAVPRSDALPLKRAKVETEMEPKSAAGRSRLAASSLMPKSGRTVCLLPTDPQNSRKRQKTKDPSKPTVQPENPTTAFTKPRVTPQERLASFQPSAKTVVETNSQERVPQEVCLNTLSLRPTPPSRTVASVPVQAPATPSLKGRSFELNRKITLKEPLQPTTSDTNAPIFKRSNTIRKLAANSPIKAAPTANSSSPPLVTTTPIREPSFNDLDFDFGYEAVALPRPDLPSNAPLLSSTTAAVSTRRDNASTQVKSEAPEFTFKGADPSSAVSASCPPAATHSSGGGTSGAAGTSDGLKRSDIWVQPAMEINAPTKEFRRRTESPDEKALTCFRAIPTAQAILRGSELIARIRLTSREDSNHTQLVPDHRHPLLIAWKRRGNVVKNIKTQETCLTLNMSDSLLSIRKLLNTYWASPYFTEELLTHTVNSLLNPKYGCVDAIAARLMVEMVDIDFDSEPCVGSPGPGQYLTKVQQQMVALIMGLFPTYPTIVRDVLSLIEYHTFTMGRQPPESGKLSWLSVLHTSLCRIMNWRDSSLIFCYDAMYCVVYRFATVLNSVFQVWPQLLPHAFDNDITGNIFQVITHFIMTQGEPATNSDLRVLRPFFVKKKAFSGATNSSELTQIIIQKMKEGECGPISPALILISKREDIMWAQDQIVNKYLLPMIRDWLLNRNDPASRSFLPCAVTTLCGIVRAFRGPEPSVSTTHTLMKTILLDGKGASAVPDVEFAAAGGLVFLSRHDFMFAVSILKLWEPRGRAPDWLIRLLSHMMCQRARPVSWWTKEIGDLLLKSEPFLQFT